MRKIKLTLEYEGTDLCGWQRQDNGPSVQQHLEEALAAMLGHDTPVVGASRTDAGVHAEGQVAAFETERAIPVHGIRRGLTSSLPHAIAVVAAEEVDGTFHPRFDARGKHYRYDILARPAPSPLRRRRTWHRPQPLDLAAMQAAAAPLVGEHDFAAFRASGCQARTTTREITEIGVRRTGDLVTVNVRGNAFLRNMVRIVVGTLVDVGQGRRDQAELTEILTSRDRTRAGQTAPAHGLTLVRVLYPGEIIV